ncbi:MULTISPECIES: hypothetical protein [unclassified Psychrobacter]|uniref:hypothetical protein n=1 Tax=unclassified Psychrobacter TaxID=196806 RepID=UPI0025FC9602|nr:MULTISPECIES: hypothetical protein [unclassified Psychrobacter]
MNIKNLFTFILLTFLLSACISSKPMNSSVVNTNNKPKLSNVFSYYDESNNVQFTALITGKFIFKNNCLFLADGGSVTTPVFNTDDVKFNAEKREVYLNGEVIPLDKDLMLGGGFVDSKYLPKLDSKDSDNCLTDRVAVLYSVVEDTPELRKRWLIP